LKENIFLRFFKGWRYLKGFGKGNGGWKGLMARKVGFWKGLGEMGILPVLWMEGGNED
jgi:hypothetical protein